ncbi:MAG TPA: 3-deoxy-manno-octulosonate-8-phosphatase KdsC [Spongiibacteraceae bacterium]|nr:3-deoxy-manno-octulosonate-8-phosphatase KdsC [Spongiibacteraceae bacterium]
MLEATQKAREIKLLVLDVDGVLTDGRLWYGNSGEELKAFHIQDGLGIKLLQSAGVDVAIITGRTSQLVNRRGSELGIKHIVQGREDKLVALRALAGNLEIGLEEIAYVGDDLPDLSAIAAVGLGIAVANAMPYVAQHAAYKTARSGGDGAVREVCDLILQAQGKLEAVLERYRQ